MSPKWQRARILAVTRPENSDAIGHLTWALPPRDVSSFEHGVIRGCQINTVEVGGFRPEQLEFLARDENDFADVVPLIEWDQFLAECRSTHSR